MKADSTTHGRKFPAGAEASSGGVHFRVWAPVRRHIEVVFESNGQVQADCVELESEGQGYFSALVTAEPGMRYRFRVDGQQQLCPDPASRFQPEGPFGPSQIVDPKAFAWTDANWPGVSLPGQVIYELHVGTFTPEGTWDAARRQLPELASMG
ncbi:MAG TPA: malto-oligosyltrehalose trehalohydrolase, partial [Pirellulales bacterium]|nr:malto-oligosyltrehalose trehalohydrolase [Pirellulales bacterium]